jgi:hypothetical protein
MPQSLSLTLSNIQSIQYALPVFITECCTCAVATWLGPAPMERSGRNMTAMARPTTDPAIRRALVCLELSIDANVAGVTGDTPGTPDHDLDQLAGNSKSRSPRSGARAGMLAPTRQVTPSVNGAPSAGAAGPRSLRAPGGRRGTCRGPAVPPATARATGQDGTSGRQSGPRRHCWTAAGVGPQGRRKRIS